MRTEICAICGKEFVPPKCDRVICTPCYKGLEYRYNRKMKVEISMGWGRHGTLGGKRREA
jgi:hypothetical protein